MPPAPALQPQTDLAILNWRREKSVFLGTNQPQEDASWIFQLRMAELERAKIGPHQRAAAVAPARRAAVRLRDLGPRARAAAVRAARRRPRARRPRLLARPSADRADVITGTWIADRGAADRVAAARRRASGCSACYLQFSISDAYARRDTQSQLGRALRARSASGGKAWACGFPLLAPILSPSPTRSSRRTRRPTGTSRRTCLVDARAARRAQHGDRRLRARGDALALRRRVAPADGRLDRLGADDDHRRDAVRAIDQFRRD